MKRSYKIIFLLLIAYSILAIEPTFAQSFEEPQITPLEKAFIQIFSKSEPSKVLKDSVSIYAINFKIEVIKVSKNKTLVTKITANDSLGYALFPKYLELKKLDYMELFSESEKKISIIMPILIYGHTENKIKYRDEKGDPLISLKSATNTAFHLYTSYPYSNLKEGEIGFPGYRTKYKQYQKRIFDKQIILTPMISDITTVN